MIHPADSPSDSRGKYKRYRHFLGWSLILLFLALPWIQINGQPAILVDFWHRRFSLLGVRFWAHEAPKFFFILATAGLLLAWVTAVFGRIWCGWGCPQTVYGDFVYRRIERLIEGDAVKRRQLDQQPWNANKLRIRGTKFLAFVVVSIVLSHGFMAYFIGTEALLKMVKEGPSLHLASFLSMLFISAAILFDFGYLRETWCAQLCPYGRLQSVFMDPHSLAILYDAQRGEPRRTGGDCVDCKRCIQVCPTGIDIRKGLQLECVACAACADACNEVMSRLNKPVGLIRYASESGDLKPLPWRFRPLAYLTVIMILAGGLITSLLLRDPVSTSLVRQVGAPYQEILHQSSQAAPTAGAAQREIVNRFHVDFVSQSAQPVQIALELPTAIQDKGVRAIAPALPLTLNAGENKRIDLFFQFPVSALENGRRMVQFRWKLEAAAKNAQPSPLNQDQEVSLVGPLR